MPISLLATFVFSCMRKFNYGQIGKVHWCNKASYARRSSR